MRNGRWRLFMVLLAIFSEGIFFIIQIAGLGPADIYDVTMLGYLIGTIFMYIAIFSFNLPGTREIAREFVIDRISGGIIAVDNDGVIQYFNEPAAYLFENYTS